MIDFILQHIPCVIKFLGDPVKVSVSLVSVFAALLLYYNIRGKMLSFKWRIASVYAHLALLIFPLVFFVYTMSCEFVPLHCATFDMLTKIIYAIPITLLLATFVGFFAIPFMHLWSRKANETKGSWMNGFVEREAKKLGMKSPKIYFIDDANPVAFSFRTFTSAIFVSVGLSEILERKEMEAVLLHELSHLKRNSSFYKFSVILAQVFSPVAALKRFNSEISEDEREADAFAIEAQGTERHLLSAKRKIGNYEKFE